ncbi:hypothetical protein [Aliivibrio salmonicida]|uniref:hypothetical protein n=1 Tax=Aliivibrio salmonicida TaxID=40269 RepID=UPI003D10CD00
MARRNSALQADTLFILLLRKNKGKSDPIQIVDLRNILNKIRTYEVGANSFRDSIHTLAERGYLDKYRTKSLRLAVTLTETGVEHASELNKERLEQIK